MEDGLLDAGDLVHQLPVAEHVVLEPLAAAADRQEVRREAAQPVGPGLAQEAAGDQPGQLLAHVLQRGQGRQLGPAAQHPVGVTPVGEDPEHLGQHRLGPRRESVAAGRHQRGVLLVRADGRTGVHDVGQDRRPQVVEELGDVGVRRAGQTEPAGGVEAGRRVARRELEQQEPSYAEPVSRLGLVAGAEDPQTDGRRPRR